MIATHFPVSILDDAYMKKDQVIQNHAQPDNTTFDARVHNVCAETSNTVTTILLRRSDQFIMALLEPGSADNSSLDIARNLTAESLVRVLAWTTPEHQRAKNRSISEAVTILVCRLVVLSEAKGDIPKNLVSHGAPGEEASPLGIPTAILNERLDNRLLDVRVAATGAIFKLSSGVHELAVEHLAALGFSFVPTPTLINYEFPGEEHLQFSLPYFDKSAWLTQTGEVHLGMALAADLDRVYDFHTVFRREEGIDARHLTEFTMVEMVFALQNDWTEILDLAEGFLIFLARSLREREKYIALTQVARRLYPSAGTLKIGLNADGKLLRIKFSEAKAILRKSLGLQSDDKDDLTKEEEAALGRYLSNGTSNLGPATDLFVVTHFPRHLRSFSIHPSKDDDSESYSFDIILRGQEIVTGCQLLHDHRELRSAMTSRAHPIDRNSPGWRPYVAAHDIGMPPWGGFGLGINRFVQGLLGLADIRETVLFPRDASRLSP